MTTSAAEIVATQDDAPPAVLRVIDADDSYVTHWPCGIVLSTRFDGVPWVCPRCGRLR